MDRNQRSLRRTQLDQQLVSEQSARLPIAPSHGWIRAFREALGMSLESFGKRLGISRQSAHQLEEGESRGSISVKRLRAAAEALDCELVILLVPKRPLQQMVEDQAAKVARTQVMRATHSMALEQQALSNERVQQMIEETARKLIDRGDPHLWE